jgi:hypothetical protein
MPPRMAENRPRTAQRWLPAPDVQRPTPSRRPVRDSTPGLPAEQQIQSQLCVGHCTAVRIRFCVLAVAAPGGGRDGHARGWGGVDPGSARSRPPGPRKAHGPVRGRLPRPRGGRLRRLVRHLRGPGVRRAPPQPDPGRRRGRRVRQLVRPVRAGIVGRAADGLAGGLRPRGPVPEHPAVDRVARATARRAASRPTRSRRFETRVWLRTPVEHELVPGCLDWPPPKIGGRPSMPVLVLNGELDQTTPVADAHHVATAFPGATLVEVPNTGHVSALYDYQHCASHIVRRFLRTLAAGSTACAAAMPTAIAAAIPSFAPRLTVRRRRAASRVRKPRNAAPRSAVGRVWADGEPVCPAR